MNTNDVDKRELRWSFIAYFNVLYNVHIVSFRNGEVSA